MTSGFWTLLYKELLRFWKVAFQTILAPVITALLYLLIFSHALQGNVRVYEGRVAYTAFLIPGLVMMSVLQNAFANSSSSLIQSKITGNLIFVLLPPLSPLRPTPRTYSARCAVVGAGVFADGVLRAVAPGCPSVLGARVRAASAILGTLFIAGIGPTSSTSWRVPELHHRAADIPVGVFYSIESLPPFWRALSLSPSLCHDGFRWLLRLDVAPWASLRVAGAARCRGAGAAAARGWKLRT
jgi:ABC-2 type transport system permease protein